MKHIVFLLGALLLSLPLSGSADDLVCIRKTLKVDKAGKVSFKKAFTMRADSCGKNEVEVARQDSAAEILSKLLGVDGSGSGIDADTVDGQSGFAAASALAATNVRMTAAEADIKMVQTAATSHTASITSMQTSITQLDTDLGTAEQNITNLSNGPRIVRVGTADAQYASLASAITYVASQSRSALLRWVIELGLGRHTVASPVTVPSYTTIKGAGLQSTEIYGSASANGDFASGALIRMSDSSALTDLTVENTAASGNEIGVFFDGLSAVPDEDDQSTIENRLERVRFKVLGAGSYNYGIMNGGDTGGASIVLDRVKIHAQNATIANRGVYVWSSGAVTCIANSKILAGASNGSCPTTCQAVLTYNGQIIVEFSRITGASGLSTHVGALVRVQNSRLLQQRAQSPLTIQAVFSSRTPSWTA
jgi:hypothetical protein